VINIEKSMGDELMLTGHVSFPTGSWGETGSTEREGVDVG